MRPATTHAIDRTIPSSCFLVDVCLGSVAAVQKPSKSRWPRRIPNNNNNNNNKTSSADLSAARFTSVTCQHRLERHLPSVQGHSFGGATANTRGFSLFPTSSVATCSSEQPRRCCLISRVGGGHAAAFGHLSYFIWPILDDRIVGRGRPQAFTSTSRGRGSMGSQGNGRTIRSIFGSSGRRPRPR